MVTKKVNEFGLFGNVLVVNNDVMENVSVVKTAEDGNMCHMKDYVHETGNNIPSRHLGLYLQIN